MTENSTGKPSPGNETITGKTVREEGCHLLPTEHERIWLEPAGAPDRCWCHDNVWGDEAIEYVRVDLITPAPAPQMTGHTAADIVKRIAEVSTATGAMAGEPAIELAGQIISVLAVHPEHIDRFMAEGSELFIDGTLNPEHGSMTYRANSGAILHPSVLREKNGSQQ